MALTTFAAQAVLGDYLNGRKIADPLHHRIVQSVGARLLDGSTPVLDRALCKEIDRAADASRGHEKIPRDRDHPEG